MILAAKEVVARERPRWYRDDIRVGVDLRDKQFGFLGITRQNDKGDLTIHLCQPTLNLCKAEDVSQVLFHEFVHVGLWEALEAKHEGIICRRIEHELMANAEVIMAYEDLGYNIRLLMLAVRLYREHYLQAVAFCPREVWELMPAPSILE
jgi:hypothetical protein